MFDETELNELYRYALALCQDSDAAYDLVYSNIEKFLSPRVKAQHVNHKMAYIKRCIRNSYFDGQRHNKIRLVKNTTLANDYLELQNEVDSLEQVMIKQQTCDQLLQSLKPDERELLFLWAVEGYTAQEIADLQGGARGTWLSRIHRIKQRLRKQFGFMAPENREKMHENT